MARCKTCRAKGAEMRFGLSLFCSFECAVEKASKLTKSAQSKRVKIERSERTKKLAVLNQTVSHWRPKADTAFQLFCRLRDYGNPCISCGVVGGQMHGGHYVSKGAKKTLTRYAEDNCSGQCATCNERLSGNIACYRPNLLAKIGEHRLSIIEGPMPLVHWKWWHYKSVYSWYHPLAAKMRKELEADS